MSEQIGCYLIDRLEIRREPRDRLPVGPLTAYATARDEAAVLDALARAGFPDAARAVVTALDVGTFTTEHGAAGALARRGLLAGWTCLVAWPARPYPGAPVVRWYLPEGAATSAPPRVVAGWTPVKGRMALVALTAEEEVAFNAPR